MEEPNSCEILQPVEPELDHYGKWLHPVIVAEGRDDAPFSQYDCAKGMEISIERVGYDDDSDGPHSFEGVRFADYAPDGAGWFVIAMTEDEESPFIAFARPGSPEMDEDTTKLHADFADQVKRFNENNPPDPIDMILHCPTCGLQHVDAPEPGICECGHHYVNHHSDDDAMVAEVWCTVPKGDLETDLETHAPCGCNRFVVAWNNPPHKSHLCHGCGEIWRPADVPTNGVAKIGTRGEDDTWPEVTNG